MKPTRVLTFLIALAVTGCTGLSRLVTARIEIQSGTNVVRVLQPKDTTVERLRFNPTNGVLEIDGYASSGNAAAIAASKAQWEATADMWRSASVLFQNAAALAGRTYGLPVTPAPVQAPATNARPVKLVPDDPSFPQLLYPDAE